MLTPFFSTEGGEGRQHTVSLRTSALSLEGRPDELQELYQVGQSGVPHRVASEREACSMPVGGNAASDSGTLGPPNGLAVPLLAGRITRILARGIASGRWLLR